MHPPLRIEVANEALGEALRRHLQRFDAETVAANGRCEVRIILRDRNPEHRVVNALHAIDSWLLTAGIPSVEVHLDGHSYTLHAPPAREPTSGELSR